MGLSYMDNKLSDGSGRHTSYFAVLIGVLFGITFGAAAMWLGLSWYGDQAHALQVMQMQGRLLQAQKETTELVTQRDVIEAQLAVETSTRKGLESALGTVQFELGAAREKIAFFEELLPPGPMGSVSIRRFDIEQKTEALDYNVLLMRRGANTKPFEGVLQFQAIGRRNGEVVTVTLEPVRDLARDHEDSSPPNVLALNFDQFQHSSGVLKTPDGMDVDSVSLNVLEGQTLRVSRTVEMTTPRPKD